MPCLLLLPLTRTNWVCCVFNDSNPLHLVHSVKFSVRNSTSRCPTQQKASMGYWPWPQVRSRSTNELSRHHFHDDTSPFEHWKSGTFGRTARKPATLGTRLSARSMWEEIQGPPQITSLTRSMPQDTIVPAPDNHHFHGLTVHAAFAKDLISQRAAMLVFTQSSDLRVRRGLSPSLSFWTLSLSRSIPSPNHHPSSSRSGGSTELRHQCVESYG